MIPVEAVEAAAKALWELDLEPGQKQYEDCREGTKRNLRREATAMLEAAAPYMQVNAVTILMDRGMPQRDAETALDAYRSTPPGEPYNSDAIRVDSILRAAPVIPVDGIEIGYVCRHGHFQFINDPDGDTCGTKIVGRIYVTPEPEISAATLTEAMTESLESHHRKMDEWRSS